MISSPGSRAGRRGMGTSVEKQYKAATKHTDRVTHAPTEI